jgi:hypothetical protein
MTQDEISRLKKHAHDARLRATTATDPDILLSIARDYDERVAKAEKLLAEMLAREKTSEETSKK